MLIFMRVSKPFTALLGIDHQPSTLFYCFPLQIRRKTYIFNIYRTFSSNVQIEWAQWKLKAWKTENAIFICQTLLPSNAAPLWIAHLAFSSTSVCCASVSFIGASADFLMDSPQMGKCGVTNERHQKHWPKLWNLQWARLNLRRLKIPCLFVFQVS